MTYLDGLRASESACHEVRARALKDRRDAMASGDESGQSFATTEALAAWACVERIRALIAATERVVA